MMLNLINLLDGYTDVGGICDDLSPVLRIVGIALKLIQIGVPIILIVIGVMDFAKATAAKDDSKVKEAQQMFTKRAIMAIVVFLIIPIVSVLMQLVSGDDYKDCMYCIRSPFGSQCKQAVNSADN